jgi:hypothetical protein
MSNYWKNMMDLLIVALVYTPIITYCWIAVIMFTLILVSNG